MTRTGPHLSPADPAAGTRRTFLRRIQQRFFLRFHMSLILLATALSGVLFSKALLAFQVENIMVRYPLVVLAAYLAFFCFVKLWLWYLTARERRSSFNGPSDILFDLPNVSGSRSSSGGTSVFGGGGGRSGGGGASAAFDGPTSLQGALMPTSPADAGAASGGSGGSGGSGIGSTLSGLFDFDDDGIVLLALGVLLAVTVGSAVYLIYIAPHVLSEAAFDFLLGAGLVRSYRKMNQPDWMGSVFRDTYKPFLVVLVIAFAAAWIVHAHNPEIVKISDLFVK